MINYAALRLKWQFLVFSPMTNPSTILVRRSGRGGRGEKRILYNLSLLRVVFYGKLYFMEITYKLNARELTSGFITAIQNVYPDRDIEITVREAKNSPDETEYLLQSPANQAQLSKAIENIEQGKNLVSFESLEQAIQYAEDQAVR